MDNNEKLKAYSESVVNQGIVKYSLKTGTLFGVTMDLVGKLIDLWDKSFNEVFLSRHGLIEFLSHLCWGILFFGPIMWYIYYRTNKNFNKKVAD